MEEPRIYERMSYQQVGMLTRPRVSLSASVACIINVESRSGKRTNEARSALVVRVGDCATLVALALIPCSREWQLWVGGEPSFPHSPLLDYCAYGSPNTD